MLGGMNSIQAAARGARQLLGKPERTLEDVKDAIVTIVEAYPDRKHHVGTLAADMHFTVALTTFMLALQQLVGEGRLRKVGAFYQPFEV